MTNEYEKYFEEACKWMNSDKVDENVKEELSTVFEQLKTYFYAPLEFGTAGLRSIMRPGINGMNTTTVRHFTQGLANLIKDENGETKGVAIAYDSRNNSFLFAKTAAEVLAASNIKVYFYEELHPTPTLSFAIRELGCIAGINITASHNAKEYNGYKVYWEDGAQLPPNHADTVANYVKSLDIFKDVHYIAFEDGLRNGLITLIGKEIDEKYLCNVLAQQVNPNAIKEVANDFKIVYTPIHGTGYRLVPEVLKRAGIKEENLLLVKEQMILDGNFPTTSKPNPEIKECFNLGIELAKENNCDLLIGTDPDADRTGIVIKTNTGNFITLSGNQVGALLVNYIIQAAKETNTLPANACVIKTIVTTELVSKICKENNVTLLNVLTGFKFIGEKIKEFEASHEYTYLFGFEESYGYLKGTYARDKDAVVASLLITEMAAYYKKQGKTLYDALMELYQKYGYFLDAVFTVKKEGVTANEEMKKSMQNLRSNLPNEINGIEVLKIRDYQSSIIKDLKTGEESNTNLPVSNVIFFEMADGSNLIVRPSGTEPIIKIYCGIPAENAESANAKLEEYKKELLKML